MDLLIVHAPSPPSLKETTSVVADFSFSVKPPELLESANLEDRGCSYGGLLKNSGSPETVSQHFFTLAS